nr:uncharacterized mitochondrial protein AtMg00810-like [Populus alba]
MEGNLIIVSIYVDDIVYTSSSERLLSEFKKEMMQRYEMSDLGLLHHFLGMGILQTNRGVFIHQGKYAKSLLSKFRLDDCKPVSIPLATGEKLKKVDGSELADEGPYRKIVGSLLYLTATRPDLMYAASLLSRFMTGPTKIHMRAAKRVLRYVQGTLSYGIQYVRNQSTTLIGFCDTDWAGSEDDSRSTSGYAFSFGSGAFSWSSVKQNTVALSTAEAEYVSASEATAQAIWLRFVLDNFGEMQAEATSLFCDNMSAISMAKNPVFHQRKRHINRKYYFIREALQEGVINVKFYRNEEQLADIFTKQNCTGLYTLFDTVNSPVSVHMQVLRRAIHKEDTDEDALSRVIVTRAEKDLKEIKELYLKRNNVSLDQAVAADTHGEYKEFLLTLLGNEKN